MPDAVFPKSGCRVCRGAAVRHFLYVEERDYWRCDECQATFLDAGQHPAPAVERAHYQQHQNNPADAGYRRFLSTLTQPLLAQLPPHQEGLDYGCGPGPTLDAMLTEAGHRMWRFDPYFYPALGVLDRAYDFVTCTEVVEHFHDPAAEFERLDRLLHPGGWLGLMTCFQTDDAKFANWHYRRDPTHVVFYREHTLRQIAAQYGWQCLIPAKDVALMQKPAG